MFTLRKREGKLLWKIPFLNTFLKKHRLGLKRKGIYVYLILIPLLIQMRKSTLSKYAMFNHDVSVNFKMA